MQVEEENAHDKEQVISQGRVSYYIKVVPGGRLLAIVIVLDYGCNNVHHASDAQHYQTQGNVEGREVERGLWVLEEAVDSDLREYGEH